MIDCGSAPRIRFRDSEYLLIGGAIATRSQFENGQMGFAHVFEDGLIRRYGTVIGSVQDITFLGRAEQITMSLGGLKNLLEEGASL